MLCLLMFCIDLDVHFPSLAFYFLFVFLLCHYRKYIFSFFGLFGGSPWLLGWQTFIFTLFVSFVFIHQFLRCLQIVFSSFSFSLFFSPTQTLFFKTDLFVYFSFFWFCVVLHVISLPTHFSSFLLFFFDQGRHMNVTLSQVSLGGLFHCFACYFFAFNSGF